MGACAILSANPLSYPLSCQITASGKRVKDLIGNPALIMDEISKKCGAHYMTSSSTSVNKTHCIPFIYVIIKKESMISYFRIFPPVFKFCTFWSVLSDDFLTFSFFLQSSKIFVYSIKNTYEPFSEKSLFDYLCGSFHSSLIFLWKYIYEKKLFSLLLSSHQRAGEKRHWKDSLHE